MLYSPAPMHIPDGFLSPAVALVLWGVSALIVGLALRQVGKEFNERQIPLMGVMAAFIFAAQMINFAVAGGTSGHLLGGTLAAITLGPWGGMVTMASVIVVQGLLFQDGGLLVMGANILNMGLITVLLSYGLYRGVAHRSRGARLAAAGVAAWLSVMGGALATSLELWLSGTARLDIVVPAMLAVHALIGIGEALITVAALAFILRTRPDLVESQALEHSGRGWVGVGLFLSLGVVLLSPLASADPDGLERVAINLGFINKGSDPAYRLLPNYNLPFLPHGTLSTVAAGALGVLVAAGAVIALIRLARRGAQAAPQAPPPTKDPHAR